jgi:hypothetical protein
MKVSKAQRAVLKCMVEHPKRRYYEEPLLARLGKTRMRVRQSLKALEKKGCVERCNWNTWKLTKKGRSALKTESERLAEELTPAGRRELLRMSGVMYLSTKIQVATVLEREGLVELDIRARLTGKGQGVKNHLRRSGV